MRHRRGQLIPLLPTVRFSHFSHCGSGPVGVREYGTGGVREPIQPPNIPVPTAETVGKHRGASSPCRYVSPS